MISVQPKTDKQKLWYDLHKKNPDGHFLVVGSAGTGKTFCTMDMALRDLLEPSSKYDKIIIIRSAVSIRGQGFLPGTIEEKNAVFERPYSDVVDVLMQRKKSYANLKELGKIEFDSTSYLRGLTYDNCIVILDEVQNFTWPEIYGAVTRLGEHSKLVILGDELQDDLVFKRFEESGIQKLHKVATKMKSFNIVTFQPEDIVRSGFVKEFITQSKAVQDYHEIDYLHGAKNKEPIRQHRYEDERYKD